MAVRGSDELKDFRVPCGRAGRFKTLEPKPMVASFFRRIRAEGAVKILGLLGLEKT